MIHDFAVSFDLDQTLVDFDRGVFESFGLKTSHLNKSKTLMTELEAKEKAGIVQKIVEAGVEFWENLPLLEDGKELWNYVNINFHHKAFLTAYIAECKEDCTAGKKLSVEKHFGVVPDERNFICCKSVEKQNYVNHFGKNVVNILIDDRLRNIEQWEAAGGIGILHKNADDTIAKLKQIVLVYS